MGYKGEIYGFVDQSMEFTAIVDWNLEDFKDEKAI